MNLEVFQEYEATGIMHVTLKSKVEKVDIDNPNFRIDILDLIKANAYYSLNHNNESYNDATDVFIINHNNYKTYLGSSDVHLLKNGIQIWSVGSDELHIRILQKSDVYENNTKVKTVGFNAVKLIIGLNTYNDINKNADAIVEEDVFLMPGIHIGKIYKVNPDDADPTIETSAIRTDYKYDNTEAYIDKFYANTSAGTDPVVPMYAVNSSAYISEEYYKEGTEIELNYENVVSKLQDSNTTANYIDIPYSFIKEGVEEELTLLSNETSAAKVKCKVWEIKQEIYSDIPYSVNKNKLILSMDV